MLQTAVYNVTIYRAVPKNVKTINPGDWVTIVAGYAKEHGDAHLGGRGKYRTLRQKPEYNFDKNRYQEKLASSNKLPDIM